MQCCFIRLDVHFLSLPCTYGIVVYNARFVSGNLSGYSSQTQTDKNNKKATVPANYYLRVWYTICVYCGEFSIVHVYSYVIQRNKYLSPLGPKVLTLFGLSPYAFSANFRIYPDFSNFGISPYFFLNSQYLSKMAPLKKA